MRLWPVRLTGEPRVPPPVVGYASLRAWVEAGSQQAAMPLLSQQQDTLERIEAEKRHLELRVRLNCILTSI